MLEHELLTVKEVASFLKLGEESIRRLIRAGKLKATKITKSYRIRRGDLESFEPGLGAGEDPRPGIDREKRDQALQAIDKVFEECRAENWDGHGAKPVSLATRDEARRFCQHIPASFPEPEVAADPDGEISLEWYREPRHVFSVSVGRDRRLTYAGLFGEAKTHGTEYLEAGLPEAIEYHLRRLYG